VIKHIKLTKTTLQVKKHGWRSAVLVKTRNK